MTGSDARRKRGKGTPRLTRERATPRRRQEGVWGRVAALAIVAVLLFVGLFPGPLLVLMRAPEWRTNLVLRQFAEERAYWLAGLVVVVGPAVALAHLASARFDRAWATARRRLAAIDGRWFVLGCAAFAAIVAGAVATWAMARKPTTSDEAAQLWHARILLAGRLALPADPNPEFFALDNIVDRGRWYSQFPIGGPAALALAMSLRATWLLNPILAGLTVVNVHRFAAQAWGTGEARVGAVLCATCSFVLLMSASFMNHTMVAFLATLALAELSSWTNREGRRRTRAAIVIGLTLGMAIAVRPMDGAIAAVVLGGFMVFAAVREGRLGSLVLPVAAGALPIAGLLVANWLTTGRPLLFGYEVLWGANHAPGFHDDPSGVAHTPARAVAFATAYLLHLNWSRFAWPVAGIVVVAAAIAFIRSFGRWEVLLAAWIGAQLVAYSAYWLQGLFFGPRYLFTVVPALLLITARGLAIAERAASSAVRRTLVAALAASLIASWAIPRPPVGALGAVLAARPVRAAFKVDFDPAVRSLKGREALVFISEAASSRLVRRLWGLGISRSDGARLVTTRDNCALLNAVLAEAGRSGSPSERLARLERTRGYAPAVGYRVQAADPSFRISDPQSVTPECRAELRLDALRRVAVSYGQALLLNEIGADGRIAGPVVFVADLAEHNEALRGRYGDRPWYRLVVPSPEESPRLVPYE